MPDLNNPETIEIHGLRTITKLCHFGADNNMEGCTFTEIVERLFAELQKAKAQAVPVWISTDFMKPDDNDYVDILINGKRRIVDAVYLDGKFFIFPPFSKEQWTEVNNKVTHWMPRVEVASESGAEG
ncbi:TPA: DUF551 domain-containing protein [Acinetobacter baumannii]|nr:hypothetical protein [Acinetobacter baumannii]